jgi:hypothetical protein
MDGPHPIALQSPEGLFRMVGPPTGSKLLKKFGEFRLGLTKGDRLEPSLPTSQRIQNEQWLVRGSLIALRPNAEVVEAHQNRIACH